MKVYMNNIMIADQVATADTFLKRFVGLMGKKDLSRNEGLVLKKCASIHCFFMKFPIDAVYLSVDMTVLWIETIPPWKLGSIVKGTKNILELAEGTAKPIILGEQLTFKKN